MRLTSGRVSRHGAMAAAWRWDKAGPIARTVTDRALALEVINEGAARDWGSIDAPFGWEWQAIVQALRVGYVRRPLSRGCAGDARAGHRAGAGCDPGASANRTLVGSKTRQQEIHGSKNCVALRGEAADWDAQRAAGDTCEFGCHQDVFLPLKA